MALSKKDSDGFDVFDSLVDDFIKEMDGELIPLTEEEDDEDEEVQETAEIMAIMDLKQGWGNFKARMEEMLTRCEVGNAREKAGLSKNPPRLHTALIGNPGTGKTTAVELMAALYHSLGLLDTDHIQTMHVSALATAGINSENDAVSSAVCGAKGGTLVIDGAHELYRTDNKGNYDTESRIVRALVDCLNDPKYDRWMLVLVGEPEGMESLLSSYPDLKKCLTAPIYMEDFKPEELFGMFDLCCNERKIRCKKPSVVPHDLQMNVQFL